MDLAAHQKVAQRWFQRIITALYSPEFYKWVWLKRFRHPDTGNQVLFYSLPSAEQKKIHDEWKGRQSPHKVTIPRRDFERMRERTRQMDLGIDPEAEEKARRQDRLEMGKELKKLKEKKLPQRIYEKERRRLLIELEQRKLKREKERRSQIQEKEIQQQTRDRPAQWSGGSHVIFAGRVASRWFGRIITALYSPEFYNWVWLKKFRHPETGNRVLFHSLPSAEQKKIHDEWEARKPQHQVEIDPQELTQLHRRTQMIERGLDPDAEAAAALKDRREMAKALDDLREKGTAWTTYQRVQQEWFNELRRRREERARKGRPLPGTPTHPVPIQFDYDPLRLQRTASQVARRWLQKAFVG